MAAPAAPDSSVLVAGFWAPHEAFDRAQAGLERVLDGGRLIAHTIAETYATLTAAPFDVGGDPAISYLEQFGSVVSGIPPQQMPDAVAELRRNGIGGGASYDGLIAISAREAGLELLSLDRRASRTYDALGIEYELL